MIFSARAPRLFVLAFFLSISYATTAPRASEATPLLGCYERRYDAAHLASHPGQIVLRVRLNVTKTAIPSSGAPSFVADAHLEIWVKKNKQAFNSLGACMAEGDGLICNGSLSAAEVDLCKTKADGVRQCRIDYSDAGSFHIARKDDAVMIVVRKRLELGQAGSDSGPYLYLSPENSQNHAFLLERINFSACKQ